MRPWSSRTEEEKFFRIPRIWDGTAFILGGGPSVNRLDIRKLYDKRVIATNAAYRLGPWDVTFFGDLGWHRIYGKGLAEFAGLKVTIREELLDRPDLHVVRRDGRTFGISEDPGVLRWNLSTGACAVNLATLLGAKRIVLLGFDMRKIDGKNNWHTDYRQPANFNPYYRFLPPFDRIAADLVAMGIECLNATPGSALTHFPVVEPEEVL